MKLRVGSARARTALAVVATGVMVAACAPPPSGPGIPPGTITELGCVEVITTNVILLSTPVCTSFDWEIQAGAIVDLNGRTLSSADSGCEPTFEPSQSISDGGCDIRLLDGVLRNGSVVGPSLYAGSGGFSHLNIRSGGGPYAQVVVGSGGYVSDSSVETTTMRFGGNGSNFGQRLERNTILRTAVGFADVNGAMHAVVVADNEFVQSNLLVSGYYNVFDPGSTGSIVRNTFSGSVVRVPGANGMEIADNSVEGGAGTGIYLKVSEEAWETTALTDNRSVGNAGHGIVVDDPAGLVIASGNVASGNGLEPQCVGIVCS